MALVVVEKELGGCKKSWEFMWEEAPLEEIESQYIAPGGPGQ